MSISDYRKKLMDEVEGSQIEKGTRTDALLELAGDRDKIRELIGVINDEKSPIGAKAEAIDSLNVISNFSPVLPTEMPELVNALRGQMASEDRKIRSRVFSTLTTMKDEVAQERLLSDLESDKSEEEKLVPTAAAICMLGQDEKAIPAPVLRKIAEHPPNTESLVAAVRHMSADPESVGVLRKIMADDKQPLEARAVIPEMISKVDPEGFLKSVNEILAAEGVNDELAPFLMKGVAGLEGVGTAETKEMIRNLMHDSSDSFQKFAKDRLFKPGDQP